MKVGRLDLEVDLEKQEEHDSFADLVLKEDFKCFSDLTLDFLKFDMPR